ncbi:MAG: flagellar export chaperone FliS [Gammaproteobacteria bacterium RBG_16_57_12]|nr:MAG: flagellar export chaperone FliS [Gammaproteobacteria bacterium RBG_16_57_12]
MPFTKSALNQYSRVGTESGVANADPHRLIQMLMEGALEKISVAKGCMQRGEVSEKGRQISWAISIINGLAAGLDMEKGGEIAQNLNALYDYMCGRLLESNIHNKVEYLDEVSELMHQIKAGWDAIPRILSGQPVSSANVAPGNR